jgi:hypothetical protein
MLCLFITASCAPVLKGPLDSDRPEAAVRTLDHGYGLLVAVLQPESSATLIFGVKHASKETEALVRRISNAAANGLRAVQDLQVLAPPIKTTAQGLPLIEVSVRNHIMNTQAASLLLAGDSFETEFLVTQQKACNYISALASTLAKADSNEKRSAVLNSLAAEFSAFDAEVLARLCVCQSSASKLESYRTSPEAASSVSE